MKLTQPIQELENLFYDKKKYWHIINKQLHRRHINIPPYRWDGDIFIPINLWQSLISTELKHVFSKHLKIDTTNKEYNNLILAALSTISAWRYTQGVYCFCEELARRVANDTKGAVISNKHLNNIQEWAVCIDVRNIKKTDDDPSFMFVHRNKFSSSSKEKDCLILLFYSENKDDPLLNAGFAILNTSKQGCINDKIIKHNLNIKTDVIQWINPYLALLNAIFDDSTEIESDIVGLRKPHHSNVAKNINYNQQNIPCFKYAAPSNIRIWHCGNNHLYKIKRKARLGVQHNPYSCWCVTQNNEPNLSI